MSAPAEPRVSVVVPLYNAERFLEECIGSVTRQDYDQWELLLVDDGSTDGGPRIARRFAQSDPTRIQLLAHGDRVNRGASASRNLGIEHARGEFIAFLDADDLWLPEKLAEQVALLDAHPEAGAVTGPAFWWYGWTGNPADEAIDRLDAVGFPAGMIVFPPELLRRMLLGAVPIPLPSAMLFRTSAVRRVGGFEDSFRTVYTDQVFFTKLLLDTAVLASDRVWARYRRHPGSSVARVTAEGGLETATERYLLWAEQYLAESGARGTPLWRALQKRIWRHRHPRLARAAGFVKHTVRRLLGR